MMVEFGGNAARLSNAAAALFGWRPDDFWNATPAELTLLLNPAIGSDQLLDRTTIDALQRQFPDGETTDG